MAHWFSALQQTLARRHRQPVTLHCGGGRLLISPWGARVLACELPGVAGNLFFHHPDLLDADKATAALAEMRACLGGDRLWIAPEMGYMWQQHSHGAAGAPADYQLLPQMDPAVWQVAAADSEHVALATKMALRDSRTGKAIELALRREVWSAAVPAGLPAGLRSAGFVVRHQLAITGGDAGAAAGLWHLLQVPCDDGPGTLCLPTVGPARQPRCYFKPWDARHVRCCGESVRVLIDGRRVFKLGLLPGETTGRMGYLRPLPGGAASLIVRIFATQPGQPYADIPPGCDQPLGGDVLQVYNSGGPDRFGEMEYHEPALIVGRGPQSSHGQCLTFVFAGAARDVRLAARSLGVLAGPIKKG